MFLKQDFNLIVAIVSKGFCDVVIDASKRAGAEGATIINARGSGIHEQDTFLGVAIQPEKEIVLILVKKITRKKVMREIVKSCGMTDEGRGMVFSLPVDEIGGISHLLAIAKKSNHKTATKKTTEKSSKNTEKSVKNDEKSPKEAEKSTKTNEKTELEKTTKSGENAELNKSDKTEKKEQTPENETPKKTEKTPKNHSKPEENK